MPIVKLHYPIVTHRSHCFAAFFVVFILLLLAVIQCRPDRHARLRPRDGVNTQGRIAIGGGGDCDEQQRPATISAALAHGVGFVRELYTELADVTRQVVMGENSVHITGRRSWRFADVEYHPAGVEDELAPGVPVPSGTMDRGDDYERVVLGNSGAEESGGRYDADRRGEIELQQLHYSAPPPSTHDKSAYDALPDIEQALVRGEDEHAVVTSVDL